MGTGTGTAALSARDTGYPVMHYISCNVLFSDNGVAKVVGTLPLGAVIDSIKCYVATVFNDSGTDLITVGTTTSSTNEYVSTGMDVSAVGVKTGTLVTPGTSTLPTADTIVYAKYAGQNSNMTTGAAVVVVYFIPRVN